MNGDPNNDMELDALNEAIRDDPDDAELFVRRAKLLYYYEQGQRQQAMADLDRALELNPRHSEALSLRAGFHHDVDENDECIADCNSALAIDPNNADAYCSRAAAWLGKEPKS
jgi:tetratricopeptide (TPR) repeat protein